LEFGYWLLFGYCILGFGYFINTMKVLLINPPIQDFYFTPQRAYPLGLSYLASPLKQNGFNVKILNCPAEYKKITLKIPTEFNYLKEYYKPNKSPFCLFSNYYHFGLTYEEIEENIKKFNPQIIGISGNFSAYIDSTFAVAQIAKRIDKRIVVVCGGRAATACPEIMLKNKNLDFVIRGEAEYSLSQLCMHIKGAGLSSSLGLNRISGLCFRLKNKNHIDNRVNLIKDLNLLPLPQMELINHNLYKFQGMPSASLISSRGCSLGCKFCGIKEKFRHRRAENVLEEIAKGYSLGARHFNFEDDNANCNPEFEKILDLLIVNFSGKIKISFMNGLLGKGINKNLRQKLQKCGLTHIDLSLISAKEPVRREASRPEQQRNVFSLANSMAKINIPVTVHFIVALPYQKIRDSLADLKILSSKRVFLGPSIFYPVIESPFFDYLKDNFSTRVEDYRFFRGSCAYFDKFIPRNHIFFVFYLSRIINFIKYLLDAYSLSGEKFFSFLREKTDKFDIHTDNFFNKQKIDKTTLGLVALRKMLREYKVFRIKETASAYGFSYDFVQEKFIDPVILKSLLNKLKVSAASGSYYIKIKKGAI